MSARLQLMLKRHPQITTYYKLEAAAKVSSTCLRNMRDGNNEKTYGLSLMNAYKRVGRESCEILEKAA